MRRPGRLLALPLMAAAALSVPAADAQQRRCDLIDTGGNTRTEQIDIGGMTIINIHDPFLVRCTDGTELRADRGSLNQATRELQLWGNVFFQDPVRTLTAEAATYNSGIGRLHARENVVFRNLEEGSTIRGPDLEYFSATETRPQAQVNARQRPHLTLQPREADEDAEPLEIDGDQVTIYGRDQLSAIGNVIIIRSDMRATAREAQYNGATGGLELRGGSTITSQDYDLAGEVIQARTDDGVLQHVHARTNASLAGEDLTVTAPDLQLFFENELLNSAVARAPRSDDPDAPVARAIATSPTFRLEADSIEALIPGQRVERVTAIGTARGESIDTLGVQDAPVVASADVDAAIGRDTVQAAADDPRDPAAEPGAGRRGLDPDRLIDRDWIRGDTIVGYFAAGDTAGAPGDTATVLERIVSRGSALSLYRMEKQGAQPGDGRRGINFLAGDVIELSFAAGELELAEVDGLQKGIFLDPAPAPARSGETAATRGGG